MADEDDVAGDVTDEDEAADIEQNAEAPSTTAQAGEAGASEVTNVTPVREGGGDAVDGPAGKSKEKSVKEKKVMSFER